MKKWNLLAVLFAAIVALPNQADALDVRAYSLTQLGAHKYDANPAGQAKTDAQNAVDYLKSIGVRHVVLTPIAKMDSVRSSNITPETPSGAERTKERQRYMRLIAYAKGQGMTVGIRPIILLDRKPGDSPADWHGNIKPADPAAWFDSLRAYLDIYVNIAKVAKAEEFTVAAELYSMTVGLEDQWPEQPFGFPREWTLIFRDIKGKLGPETRVMYDANYTDATTNDDGTGPSGGEFERWRYRLADLKPDPSKPATMDPKNVAAWQQMEEFWKEIDVFGLDVYRTLMPKNETIPPSYGPLVSKLKQRVDQYATDIDSKLFEIETAVGYSKRVILKEIGYKSCTGCFIDPFEYDDPRRETNVPHQAAAYDAVFQGFVQPQWPWLMGISFWDVAVDPGRAGAADPGFTPRGKSQTEEVIKRGWDLK